MDAHIGQHVRPDGALMTVVPIAHVYVDANFKEGQLDRVRPGQPVTLTCDLYGAGVVFHGQLYQRARIMGLQDAGLADLVLTMI